MLSDAVLRLARGGVQLVVLDLQPLQPLSPAVFLVMRSLQLPIDRLDVFLDAYLTHAEINTMLQQIDLRVKKRMPAAYILKEAWLQGYRFYVDERAIIPRSFIAELLRDGLAPWVDDSEQIISVLDMCTGSGCLAILAAHTFPNAEVDAVDLSEDALAVAEHNVDDYGLHDRVRLVQSNLFEAPEGERYDIILSNPPFGTAKGGGGPTRDDFTFGTSNKQLAFLQHI